MSKTMKAMGVPEDGKLQEVQVPIPKPSEKEILVQVKAVAVNPVDFKLLDQRGKAASGGHPHIVGFDCAGIVKELGSNATKFKEGDEVYFSGNFQKDGCNAEYVTVDERITSLKPKKLSFTDAASIPLTAITAWEAFFENLHLPADGSGKDITVLILNGAGGVGSIAIQLARKVLGAKRVVATASREETINFVKELGATDVINHRKSISEQMKELGLGADAALIAWDVDNAGFQEVVKSLNPMGSVAMVIPPTEAIDFQQLFFKRCTVSMEMMFLRPSMNIQPEKQGELLQKVADRLDSGDLIHTRRSEPKNLWKDLVQVHETLRSGKALGKTVLEL
eukprot:gb/GECH01012028.1/.p1 GENE.gb/GECH01012028.1/~~gb/GECH01012028.1/.p1  ORF type:complete len:337 (+),score=94.54 gb/GECH01012028.1/:1-1011(+)